MSARSGDRGAVLVLVLLAMTMLVAAGIGLGLSSSLARLSAANQHEGIALLNAAESALELAAAELAHADIDAVVGGLQTSAMIDGPAGLRTPAPGVTVDLLALTHRLTCGRPTPCTESQRRQVTAERPWGHANPRWRLFLHQLLDPPLLPTPALPTYVVVWIGDDAREDDDDPAVDGAGPDREGRYIVRARAEAFGPRGGRRAIEAELRRFCSESGGSDMCRPGSRVQSWRVVSAQVP